MLQTCLSLLKKKKKKNVFHVIFLLFLLERMRRSCCLFIISWFFVVFRNFLSDQAFVPFSTAICSSQWVWCMFAPSPSLVRTFWRTWLRCVVVFSTHSEASSSETTCYSAPETYCQMMESSQSKQDQLFFFFFLRLSSMPFFEHITGWLVNTGL